MSSATWYIKVPQQSQCVDCVGIWRFSACVLKETLDGNQRSLMLEGPFTSHIAAVMGNASIPTKAVLVLIEIPKEVAQVHLFISDADEPASHLYDERVITLSANDIYLYRRVFAIERQVPKRSQLS